MCAEIQTGQPGEVAGIPHGQCPQAQSLLPEGKAQVLCALCSPPPRGHSFPPPFTQGSVNKHRQSAPRPAVCGRHCSRSWHSEGARGDVDSKLTPVPPAPPSANAKNNHRGEGDTPSQRPEPGAAPLAPSILPPAPGGGTALPILQIKEAQIQ